MTKSSSVHQNVAIDSAAYARYSTDKQNSIEVQLQKIAEYCANNGLNLNENHIYTDESKTGSSVGRDGFEQMVNAARRGEFNCVVIYDLTRGSRDVVDWFNFRKEMRALGVRVISTNEHLGDISNPSDFLTELITVGIGQHHVLSTRAKTMDKIATLAAQGKFCGGIPPLGYDVQNGDYIINDYEAAAVRKIFEMYAGGGSYSEIIDWCAAQGYKGKKGKPIGKNSLHSILSNERYIGRYSWNKRQVKYMTKWAGGKPREDAVYIDDHIPPIVDKQTWGLVRIRMDERRRTSAKNTNSRSYILTGLLKCAKCGGSYVGVTSTNSRGYERKYYTCGNKKRRRDCDAKNITANDIEPLIKGIVWDALCRGELLERTADVILGNSSKEASAMVSLKKELAETDEQLENLAQALANGFINEVVRKKMDEAQLKHDALVERIAQLTPDIPVSREELIEELRQDARLLREEPEKTNAILKKYLTRIEIDDDTITIHAVCDLGEGCSVEPIKSEDPKPKLEVLRTDGCGGAQHSLPAILFHFINHMLA